MRASILKLNFLIKLKVLENKLKTLIKEPLEAPEGVFRSVTMSNGEMEVCRVVTMPDFSGPSEYACITKPKTMPFVRYSCFRVG